MARNTTVYLMSSKCYEGKLPFLTKNSLTAITPLKRSTTIVTNTLSQFAWKLNNEKKNKIKKFVFY